MRRLLPDLLTWSRVVVALVLPFIAAPVPALIAYLWCGLSDVLDGQLARRWAVDSERGAVLDTIADVAFWVGVLGWLLWRTDVFGPALWVVITGVTVIRAAAALALRRRVGAWRSIHTPLDRITGGVLFVVVPVVAAVGAMPLWVLLPVGAVAVAAALDELRRAARA
ncbi:CDP-alcohol phosphatidyltransferase family protein [Cellulomonas denverensis]|uniref:CDP-alcohol phosphatidyltransferase family protein n=1 Tax=Cellulomonas denverensis TaxID=264297 RepID=UPI0035EDC2F1